jgi:hypothetical protein
MGDPALNWRQRSLSGDATSLDHDLRASVEDLLPAGMDVKVTSIEKLADYEQPLRVHLFVKGTIGSPTGKRVLIPADIFEVNAKPSFPHPKREVPVYFDHPFENQDAIRVKFPATMKIESLPSNEKIMFQKFAAYDMAAAPASASVTIYRNYLLGTILFYAKEYPELRSFYSQMETKDQESIVLNASSEAEPKTTAAN